MDTQQAGRKGRFYVRAGLIVMGAAVAALVLGAIVKATVGGKPETSGTAKFKARRGELKISVTETGEIQAADSIKITPDVQGEATIIELVEEGTRVKKGDVLVQLDKSQLEQDAANMEIEVENAQADLTRAEEQKKIQELSNATDIAKAELAVQAAEMEVNKYGTVLLNGEGFLATDSYLAPGAPEMGEAYQQFRDAELAITRAETDLERAQSDFDGMDTLLDKGFVTKNDYISEELKVLEAQRKLESTKLAHFILRTYTFPKTTAQKESDLQQAKDRFRQTQLSAGSEMTQKEVAISEAKAVYEMKQKKLEELRDRIGKMTITAPEDGLVLYGDPANMWGNEPPQVGSKVNRGQTILTLPKVTSMIAATKVVERDINKAKVGQLAVVKMPALPDLTLTGKLSKVSSVASSGQRFWMASEVKTFDVEVSLDAIDPRMKPGMSCNVEIEVATLDDALYVPVNAVYKDGSSYVCYVLEGSKPVPKRVSLGESSDLYVQIAGGIEEGQEVFLYKVEGAAQLAPNGAMAGKPGEKVPGGEKVPAGEGGKGAETAPAAESGQSAGKGQVGERNPDGATRQGSETSPAGEKVPAGEGGQGAEKVPGGGTGQAGESGRAGEGGQGAQRGPGGARGAGGERPSRQGGEGGGRGGARTAPPAGN